MLERDGPKKINTTGPSWRRTFWGVILALLAATWIVGVVNPSLDDNRYLFALLAICATVGSSFCLFPKASESFWHAIGVGVSWLYYMFMGGLIIAGVVSFIAGAPIPAAIIAGALIIATAITQSQR